MTSQDWLGRPPRGRESTYSRENVKSFPNIPNTIPVGSVKLHINKSNESNSNYLQTDVDGYLKAMTMNEISKEQHSYANQSYLLDQTIDIAV